MRLEIGEVVRARGGNAGTIPGPVFFGGRGSADDAAVKVFEGWGGGGDQAVDVTGGFGADGVEIEKVERILSLLLK